MEKYEIDDEFSALSKRKPFVIKSWLPTLQKIMDNIQCEGDEQVIVEKGMISGYQGEKIKLHVIKPREAEDNLPCMIYLHGGGFALKASPHHYNFAKRCAAEVPCKVVMVDYRLTPQYAFPTASEDAYAAYKWVVTYAEQLKINPEKIIVAGDSAGGDLAAALTLMTRDRGIQTPCFQILIYPVTDRRMKTPSMKEFTDTPMWNSKMNVQMWEQYLPDAENVEHIEYASPMEAESFEGMPPAYIEVAELDCLRDEGIAYAKRLEEIGIPVEFYELKGAVHGYDNAEGSPVIEEYYQKRIDAIKNIIKNL